MANQFTITEKLTADQFDQLHALYQQMWWSAGRTKEEITTLLKHSLPFGLINNDNHQLVGFARVLTDTLRFAYIYDVMVSESLRNKGLGKFIIEHILSFPALKNVKYFELTCVNELVDYYKQFGFQDEYGNLNPMRLCRY